MRGDDVTGTYGQELQLEALKQCLVNKDGYLTKDNVPSMVFL